jgi:replicative DNA helicase
MSWQAKKQVDKGVMKNVSNYTPKDKFEDVCKFPIADLSARGIKKETAEKYGVRMSISVEDGKTPTAHYFPYYDQTGKLSGYKKRDLTVPKDHDYHFTSIGKVSVDCKLFGQPYAENLPRKKNNIIITEGEYDALAYFQAAVDQVAGHKTFAGLEPFVVSISLGTGNAIDSVLHNKDFVDLFDKTTLLFDNDKATDAERKKKIKKGKDAVQDVAVALMKDNVYVAEIPSGYKDACDMLQDQKIKELVSLAAFDAKKFVGEKIVTAGSITLDELFEERQEGVYVDAFPSLMKKIHGFRTRELVLLTAPSNVGKSFVCSEFAYSFLEAGETVGFMMLEETGKETVQRMLARKLKVNYNVFKDKPLAVATKEQIEEARNWLTKDRNCFLLDHFGSIPIDELMNKIKSFVHIHKCRYIILDHLSIVISGSKVADERKELDMVMTELATFCAANDVCIIAVSHINRSNAGESKPPKGKEDEPYWVSVSKESMRGSSSLEQLSWIILALEPQVMPDKQRGNVRLTVLKNRPWSYLGIADEFNMNEQTGLLECVGGRF